MPSTTDRQIRLKDGRVLGYAEYGAPSGRPMIYFHGFPASRLEGQLLEPAALRNNVRVVAVDRPGYGLSEFKPARTVGDWPDDVSELANQLGWDRFFVLAISGGGPYALACAWKIPRRLAAVSIVGGLGPVYEAWAIRDMKWPARLGFVLAKRARWLLRPIYGGVNARIMRSRPMIIQRLLTVSAPETDKTVLRRPDVQRTLSASMREALRNGPTGALWELILYSHSWGFRLEDINIVVDLWQGEADATVPISHARYQAKALPRARPLFLPREGHFSVPINYMDDILRTSLDSGGRH